MRKKKFPSILLAALLAFSILPVFPPAWAVWTGGTIYIKADGSIVPSNAPVTTRDKVTYTLTDDIKTTGNGIVVERDNIILDGNGHTITGPGSARGILLEYRKNVTIRNFKIEKFYIGIHLSVSNGSAVTGNTISNNYYGIDLLYSNGNTVTGNTITNNKYGIYLYDSNNNRIVGNVFSGCGLFVYSSYSNTVEGNTVNGKPLVYLENARDVVVKDAGQVVLVRSERIRVENSNLSNTTVGVQLWESKECKITNSTITNNNDYGIYLYRSSGGRVFLNSFIGNNRQVDSIESKNSWDDGSRGNYWSDYTGEDRNNDGIGDKPYTIDRENVDRYPLIRPYESYFITITSPYGTVRGGGWYAKGSRAVISVSPATIDHGNGTRRVFSEWYDERGNLLSGNSQFSLTVEKPLTATARWDTEYKVEVSSPYGTVRGGGWYAKGSRAVISVSPATIDHGNGTRRVFIGWYDEGGNLLSGEAQFSLTVEKPFKVVAVWKTEYLVQASSPYGTVRGGGWYAKGSLATVSVSPAVVDRDFFIYYVFESWLVDGEVASTSPEYSFTVDQPVTLTASWRSEVKLASIALVAAIVLAISIITLLVLARRRRTTRTERGS